jgi:hypothetical protein
MQALRPPEPSTSGALLLLGGVATEHVASVHALRWPRETRAFVEAMPGPFARLPRQVVDMILANVGPWWEPAAPMRRARSMHGAAVADGRVCVVGGAAEGGPVLEVETRAPSGAWRVSGHARINRGGACCAAIGRTVYTMGGFSLLHVLLAVDSDDEGESGWCFFCNAQGAVPVLSAIDALWDPLTEPDGPEYRVTRLVEAIDIDGGEGWAVASMRHKRNHACAVALGGRLYVIGGANEGAGPAPAFVLLSSAESYDPETNRWRLLAPMAVGRAYAACAAAPGARTLCVVGGVTCGHAVAASIEVYHADADVWVTVAEALPRPLYGHAAAIVGDELCVVGGMHPAEGATTRRFRGSADGEPADEAARTMHRWCLATGRRTEDPAPAVAHAAAVAVGI